MPPQLSDGHRLVFVDLRGGGRSTGDPGTLSFDQVAADFEAFAPISVQSKCRSLGTRFWGRWL